jgi:hypothetical protein
MELRLRSRTKHSRRRDKYARPNIGRILESLQPCTEEGLSRGWLLQGGRGQDGKRMRDFEEGFIQSCGRDKRRTVCLCTPSKEDALARCKGGFTEASF